MTVSNICRNLRDGELVVKDGSTPPVMLTVLLAEGDLRWNQRQRTIEVKDRGSIANGHTRKGDQESTAVNFSARWTQLLGKSAVNTDPLQLYEMLSFHPDLNLTSTSQPGEQDTLRLEFTVHDPAGAASEKIVFPKVYRETLVMAEGDDANSITFTGRDFSPRPVVARVDA